MHREGGLERMRILLWLLLGCLALLLAAPLRLTVDLRWQGGLSLRFALRIWGVTLPARTVRPSAGRIAAAKGMQRPAVFCMLASVRRLLRHVRLERLQLTGSISLPDAAQACLLCSALNQLPAALPARVQPSVKVLVLPDLWSGCQQWQGQCIISSRLGKLLPDAARLALDLLRQKRTAAARG